MAHEAQPTKVPEELSDEAAYRDAEIIRSLLCRESEFTNNRVVWMAAFQGLLFASLGFAWDKKDTGALSVIFSLLGIATAILSGIGLMAASLATRRLLVWWADKRPRNYHGPPVIGYEMDDPKSVVGLLPPWTLIPVCFILAWIAIMVIVVEREIG